MEVSVISFILDFRGRTLPVYPRGYNLFRHHRRGRNNIEYDSVYKAKLLLAVLAESSPYTLNISGLCNTLQASRNNVLKLLDLMDKAALVRRFYSANSGMNMLTKPEKVLFANTNLMYCLTPRAEDGTMRETFLASQLAVVHQLSMPSQGDLVADGRWLFEYRLNQQPSRIMTKPLWTAYYMGRMVRKEVRQVPVHQVLASYFTNFQHLSFVYSSTAACAAAKFSLYIGVTQTYINNYFLCIKNLSLLMKIQFADKLIPYEFFIKDLAREIVALQTETLRQSNDIISQNKAFKLFGAGNVRRWVKEEKLIPVSKRPGKIKYRIFDLKRLQERQQDFFKNI